MCSAPVHVKLQVSLQHSTCSGELSRLEPGGYSILIMMARSTSCVSFTMETFLIQSIRAMAAG